MARETYRFFSLQAKGNSFFQGLFCSKHSQCIYNKEYLLTGCSVFVSSHMLGCTYIYTLHRLLDESLQIRAVLFRIQQANNTILLLQPLLLQHFQTAPYFQAYFGYIVNIRGLYMDSFTAVITGWQSLRTFWICLT